VREAADLLDKRSSYPIRVFRRPRVPSETNIHQTCCRTDALNRSAAFKGIEAAQ
jgi:hypothetical protein